MKKLTLLVLLLIAYAPLHAQQLDSDVCSHRPIQSSFLPKSGTGTLIAAGANGTYVCGFTASGDPLSTGPQNVEFFYGTGASCSGGSVFLSGALTVMVGSFHQAGNAGMSLFYIPTGNNLCYSNGNIQGFFTYVNP